MPPTRTDRPAGAGPRRGQDATSAPCPNAVAQGRVLRTMWPGQAGTQRWLRLHGAELVCVRHREDPAGLRRVVTVELVVGSVAPRQNQRRLNDRALYPVRLARGERALRQTLIAHGGTWSNAERTWYLPGRVIRELGLMDRIAIDRRPRTRAPAG